ncbi:hypothetical protein D3C74_490380 [compost metagenome]
MALVALAARATLVDDVVHVFAPAGDCSITIPVAPLAAVQLKLALVLVFDVFAKLGIGAILLILIL